MKKSRLERLCNVVETCINGFFDKTKPELYRLSWYNHFSDKMDEEIEKDLDINVDSLDISDFMKTTVKRHIEHGKFRRTYGFMMSRGYKGKNINHLI